MIFNHALSGGKGTPELVTVHMFQVGANAAKVTYCGADGLTISPSLKNNPQDLQVLKNSILFVQSIYTTRSVGQVFATVGTALVPASYTVDGYKAALPVQIIEPCTLKVITSDAGGI